MRKIILLSGKKRSGKDYVAEYFKNQSFKHYSVAYPIKEIICRTTGLTRKEFEKLKDDELCFDFNLKEINSRFKDELYILLNNYDRSKKIISLIDNFDIRNLDIILDNQISARKLIQKINVFKEIFEDNDIWTNITLSKINNNNNNIIISDFRFPNEYDAIKKQYDQTISVKIIGKNYYDESGDVHISENALHDWKFDYHINNTIYHDDSIFWQVQGLIQTLEQKKVI